jgi:hypothetical protein
MVSFLPTYHKFSKPYFSTKTEFSPLAQSTVGSQKDTRFGSSVLVKNLEHYGTVLEVPFMQYKRNWVAYPEQGFEPGHIHLAPQHRAVGGY